MFRNRWLLGSVLLNVLFLALAVALWVRQSSGELPPANEPQRVDLKAAVERFRKVPVGELGVKEPITVIESDIYADGGTIYLKFRDADDTEFIAMHLSGFSHPPERCRNFLFGRSIPNPAEKLPELLRGSQQEQALCGLLARWAIEHPTFCLLLSAEKEAFQEWYGRIHSPAAHERFGKEGYNHHRALVFISQLLGAAARG